MKHLSSQEWHDYLGKTLPDGSAWQVEDNAMLDAMMQVIANEIQRLDVFIARLADELNPAWTETLLPEWEQDAQPDKASHITDRQQNLTAQLTFHETITKQFVTALAKNFGLDAVLTEPEPNKLKIALSSNTPVHFLCSDSRCGDALLDIVSDTPFEKRIETLAPAHVNIKFNYS